MPFEDRCQHNHGVFINEDTHMWSCMHSWYVQYRNNALSLGILFYYLLSLEPFTSNPWALVWAGISPSLSPSMWWSISLPICLHASLSACLSCHLLAFSVCVPPFLSLSSICSCLRLSPVHLSSVHLTEGQSKAARARQKANWVPIFFQNHVHWLTANNSCKCLCLSVCDVAVTQPCVTAIRTST